VDKNADKIGDMMKKYDPGLDKVNFDVNKINQRIEVFTTKINEMEATVDNYILSGAYKDDDEEETGKGGGGGGGGKKAGKVDVER